MPAIAAPIAIMIFCVFQSPLHFNREKVKVFLIGQYHTVPDDGLPNRRTSFVCNGSAVIKVRNVNFAIHYHSHSHSHSPYDH